jgi:nicotinate-nucleotide adenylyltransferase
VRFAILGGSFNPPHWGHFSLAEAVLAELGYDRIILVPAFTSPFKPGAEGASPQDRLDMLAASIPGDYRITVDDTEIRRQGVSYTIDTVRDIIRRYRPQGKPGLILGDDLARDFPKWRNAPEIAELADLIIARRVSADPVPFPYPHKRLNNEITAVSSALARDRRRNRQNWRYLVPEGARAIIDDRGLYLDERGESGPAGKPEGKPAAVPSAALIFRVEEAVRSMVSAARFLHSRNTALLCRDLCLRFGLDPAAGYLAGIAHDMGKALKEKELFALARKDGGGISRLERKRPSLLHGRAAAVLIRERFDIHNEDILEAVRYHTTGFPGMGPLAKVVYIADKTEVSREDADPGLRDLAGLDRMFEAVLDGAAAYLRSHKTSISGDTRRLLEAVRKEKGGHSEKNQG